MITDHRPLTNIFGPKTGIPSMTAARMQRSPLVLPGYQYNIEYIPSKESANASVCMLTSNEIPATSQQIAEATRKDTVTLANVYGWPRSCARYYELYPLFVRKDELSLEDRCIVWGRRVVIPSTYTEHLLHELLTMHPRIVRMKSIARIFMWHIDGYIEEMIRSCSKCSRQRNDPPPTSQSMAIGHPAMADSTC